MIMIDTDKILIHHHHHEYLRPGFLLSIELKILGMQIFKMIMIDTDKILIHHHCHEHCVLVCF